MANQRSGVPAGWHWRDGRPRWIPSPTLRKAGFKGRDLKDGKGPNGGQWLTRGASIDAAEALNREVAEIRAGRAAAAAPKADRRSLGALLDAYLGDPKRGIEPSREFAAIRNQIDRRSKLSRLVDVLAGYVVQPPPIPAAHKARDLDPGRLATIKADRAAYDAARATVRGFSIDVLEPPAFEDTPDLSQAQGPLYDAYWKLREQIGTNMAHGVLSDVSAWLEWCVKRRAIRQNWAKLVDRDTPPGRIRVGTWDELRALIDAAEALGLHSIADSIVLGVDLSWSQVDRLSLTWPQVGADYRVKAARRKTGRKGDTPLLAGLGRPRIDAIRARQRRLYGDNVTPTHVLICELTGKAWTGDHYRHKFAEVRALAAKAVPSVATLRDQDLRDTAITVGKAAGLTDEEVASRSLHSLKRIRDILDKHYVEIGQDVADAGAGKLDTYLAGLGVAL
ncbi:hypothetical protein [Phenylobacterium sp. SCN 70-31]|uniref:hypothetical protein n=1 Tax=Phenylobacterium sp. SCN 70-31 TaxID=1660129 RepID=UPI000A778F4D|nr:hypothetical protein [Phenylobacterium sp. SCN 70-31]